MKSIRQMKTLLPLIIFLGSLWLLASLPHGTLAQGGPLPTPTNIGDGGGNGNGSSDSDDDDRATPRPPGARVAGFVYNYSTGGYEGGVTVVLEGGGWRAEAVTDSNGFYQIGDLGFGQGIVNLRLPPDAHQIGSGWPVLLASGADLRVDLGFYWGDNPSFPVALSSNLVNGTLSVQVENRTSETITGGLLEIELPARLVASPAIQASQGTVDYGAHRLYVNIGDLPAKTNATAQVPVRGQIVPTYAEADTQVQVLFTYDQQRTPQIVQLDASSQVSTQAPLTQSTPTAVATSSRLTSAPSPPTPAIASAQLDPLPVTGSPSNKTSPINLVLPILMGVGLGLAGWQSLYSKAKNNRTFPPD
jgi:hypothetical protein